MILQTIHNFITSGYKPEYEYKYITVLLFAVEFKTHSWVYYLGRRLADPTTRRQLTGHTLRRNRVGLSEPGSKKLDLRRHFIFILWII